MRRAGVSLPLAFAALVPALLLAACSLLNSLEGFAGGADAPDGSVEASSDTSAPVEASRTDSAMPADAADAGPTPSELYAQAVLADHPLAYWRLEETSGTVAKDETGRYDGTFVLGPRLGAAGVAGSRAIELMKDTNARILVTDAVFRFVGTASYSVELWAQPGVLKDYQWLGGTEHTQSGARAGWSLLADVDGDLRYEVWRPDGDGGTNQVRGVFMPAPVVAGTLHHIVVTYNGGAVVGYVDGKVGTPFNTTGSCPDVGPLLWACRGDLNHCLDDWTIDELAIYDVPLPTDRVLAHYKLGK